MGDRSIACDLLAEGTPGVGGDDAGRRDAVVGLELLDRLDGDGTEVPGRGLHTQRPLHDSDGVSAVGLLEHRGVTSIDVACLGPRLWALLDLGGLAIDEAVGGGHGLQSRRDRLLAERGPGERRDLPGRGQPDGLLILRYGGLGLGSEVAGGLDIKCALRDLDDGAVVALARDGEFLGRERCGLSRGLGLAGLGRSGLLGGGCCGGRDVRVGRGGLGGNGGRLIPHGR